jgi:hypothetical protein
MTEELWAGSIWEGRGLDVSGNLVVPELDDGPGPESGLEYREP